MKITIPATSANMGPGFDTLGIAIELKNTVIIKSSKFNSVSLKGEGSNNPRLKNNNMFLATFYNFYENLAQQKQNFRFEFLNAIPLSRGLGSSSAVILGAIAAAYAINGIKISKEKLLNLALSYESHPDNITPAVMGGFTTAIVKDNEVHFLKKEMPSHLKAVVVIPNRPISTNLSRKVLPTKYTKEDAIFNLSHCALLSSAIISEDWKMLKIAAEDRFHQQYRMKQMPELFEIQKCAYQNGALMSTLSGSGSTFFNMCYDDDSSRLYNSLKEQFSHFRVLVCSFNNNGLEVEY